MRSPDDVIAFKGPFKNHPEIVVYHPTVGSGNGHAFANVAWAGFVGSITGISSQQMAISEIGVSFPDATFGKESRFGVPFTYLLRDILQFDTDLASSEMHLKNAACSITYLLIAYTALCNPHLTQRANTAGGAPVTSFRAVRNGRANVSRWQSVGVDFC